MFSFVLAVAVFLYTTPARGESGIAAIWPSRQLGESVWCGVWCADSPSHFHDSRIRSLFSSRACRVGVKGSTRENNKAPGWIFECAPSLVAAAMVGGWCGVQKMLLGAGLSLHQSWCSCPTFILSVQLPPCENTRRWTWTPRLGTPQVRLRPSRLHVRLSCCFKMVSETLVLLGDAINDFWISLF